jgi:hypothetical protein
MIGQIKEVRSLKAKNRHAVVLALVLAGMALLLLLLGALARRVVLEHRSLDARAQSLQADWFFRSAQNRVQALISEENPIPADWYIAFGSPELGKNLEARLLSPESSTPGAQQRFQLSLRWTTSSGIALERTGMIDLSRSTAKGAP